MSPEVKCTNFEKGSSTVPVECFNATSKLSRVYPTSRDWPNVRRCFLDSDAKECIALLIENAEMLAFNRQTTSITRSGVLQACKNIPLIDARRLQCWLFAIRRLAMCMDVFCKMMYC